MWTSCPIVGMKDPYAAFLQASDIPSAEFLEKEGLLEPALGVYARCLKECEAKIERFSKGVINMQAIDDRVTISAKLGNLPMSFPGGAQLRKGSRSNRAHSYRRIARPCWRFGVHTCSCSGRHRRSQGNLSFLSRRTVEASPVPPSFLLTSPRFDARPSITR